MQKPFCQVLLQLDLEKVLGPSFYMIIFLKYMSKFTLSTVETSELIEKDSAVLYKYAPLCSYT